MRLRIERAATRAWPRRRAVSSGDQAVVRLWLRDLVAHGEWGMNALACARRKQFMEAGWLEKEGHGRGTRYRWPKQRAGDLFDQPAETGSSSQHKAPSSQHNDESSQHKPGEPQHKQTLQALAEPVRTSQRMKPQAVRQAILDLCKVQPLSLAELAGLLGRAPASLQNHYLTPMLKEGMLQLMFPHHPNHPQQRYRAA